MIMDHTPETINILITDDHPIVRCGLRQLLEDDEHNRFGIIDEAGNGDEMFDKLSAKKYHLLLLDISLPGKSGLELLVDIKPLYPDLKVLVLSIYTEESYAIKSLKLGAYGYLTKASAPKELIGAIIKVSQGGRYISASLVEKIAFSEISNSDDPLHQKLSVREMEVIMLLEQGMTITAIAQKLELSPKTISTFRERILTKLKLKTTTDIIKYAIKEGLTSEL